MYATAIGVVLHSTTQEVLPRSDGIAWHVVPVRCERARSKERWGVPSARGKGVR
jgi:hypothetical protein